VEAQDEAAELVEALKARIPAAEIPIYELPPAIVVHGGPKTMGVGFFIS
jgi:fatty acid-binding protein DegV